MLFILVKDSGVDREWETNCIPILFIQREDWFDFRIKKKKPPTWNRILNDYKEDTHAVEDFDRKKIRAIMDPDEPAEVFFIFYIYVF